MAGQRDHPCRVAASGQLPGTGLLSQELAREAVAGHRPRLSEIRADFKCTRSTRGTACAAFRFPSVILPVGFGLLQPVFFLSVPTSGVLVRGPENRAPSACC